MNRRNALPADVVGFQTVQDFVRWKRAGELLLFKFDGFALYEDRYKDLDGAFTATNLNPLTYAYNTQLVAAADVPKAAPDFLNPRFHGQAALAAKAQGSPIDVAYSAVDPTPIFYNSIAILRAAPHPNAAKLWVTFALSKDQQIKTLHWSARRDVPPPAGLAPLASHPLADRYRDFVTQTDLVTSLRKRFLAYTGPVVNKST